MNTNPTTTPAPAPVRRTLFDIGSDLLTLDQLIEDIGGDVSDPQVEAAVTALTSELARDEAAKLDGWVGWVRQMEMEAAAAFAEADQWRHKGQALTNRVAWAKSVLKQHLENTRRAKVQTARGHTVTVQANGGKLPVQVDPVDPETVAERFQRVRVELDTDAVRTALEAGEQLAFARLQPRGTHLRIK